MVTGSIGNRSGFGNEVVISTPMAIEALRSEMTRYFGQFLNDYPTSAVEGITIRFFL
jgi:hypothetical protein